MNANWNFAGFVERDMFQCVRRERIYPFRRGNVFIRGILNGKMLDNTVGLMAVPRRSPQVINRVRFNGNAQIFAEFRRGQATRPTVLTDHFPLNELR